MEGSWLLLLLLACVAGVGVVGCRVVWCRRHARLLLLPACVGGGGWWVLSRAWCLRVWGWHAVGVLG